MARIKIDNQSLTSQDVQLDGHSWMNCSFVDCNIIVEIGDYDFEYNELTRCRLTLKGDAAAVGKIIKLFHSDLPLKL